MADGHLTREILRAVARGELPPGALSEIGLSHLPRQDREGRIRHALAALVIFQEAARREELTLQKTREIAAYLREARGNPGLRFRA